MHPTRNKSIKEISPTTQLYFIILFLAVLYFSIAVTPFDFIIQLYHVSHSKHKVLLQIKSHQRSYQSPMALILYSPQTSLAISFTSASFAHCCFSVSLFPISQEAKPHCGLKYRRSSGTYFAAS